MSEPEAHPAPAEAGRCPRCGAGLERDQEWCLSCGTAARTAIAAPPPWRVPVALIGVVVVLFGASLAWALVALTDNDAEVSASTERPTTTTVMATTPPPTAVAPAPGATTPPPPVEPPAEGEGTTEPPIEDLDPPAGAPEQP